MQDESRPNYRYGKVRKYDPDGLRTTKPDALVGEISGNVDAFRTRNVRIDETSAQVVEEDGDGEVRTVKLPTREVEQIEESELEPLSTVPWMAALKVMDTPHTIEFQIQGNMTLGRTVTGETGYPHIDLTKYGAHHLGVSRRHVLLTARENRIFIQDLGSTNGTFLNGRRLPADTTFPLGDGDRLELGKLKMSVIFTAKMPG